MFIEPRPRTAPKLRRSETLVPEKAHFAPLERGRPFRQRVYKHFAAPWRGQIIVHNFRDTTRDSQQSEFQRPKTKNVKRHRNSSCFACSLVIAHQPFRNAARFLAAFALDRDAPRRLHATLYLFDRGQCETAVNACSGRYGRNETHAIQPIVKAHSHATDRHRPLAQFAQQRESQKAVRDCFFERRFARGAIRIHVNPLPVFGTFGKLVDALLRYLEPIADGDLSSDEVAEFSNAFDLCDRHSEVSSNSEDSRRSSRLLGRRQRTSSPCRNATCAGASRPATAR